MLRRLLRYVVAPTVLAVGGDRLLRSFSGHSALNVMYHGVVLEDSTWFSPRHLTAKEFDRQLGYLKRRFQIVSLKELFELCAERRTLERPTITLSFDDGYLNNLEVALPIIERHRVPVTFFVLGTCAVAEERRVAWADMIALVDHAHAEAEYEVAGNHYQGLKNRTTSGDLMADMKRMSPDERDRTLELLDQQFHLREGLSRIHPHVWKLMDPQELKKLAASEYVEVGSHAYGHYNLGMIDPGQARADILRSKNVLEACLGRPIESIAYPDGSYSAQVKDISAELGFKRQLAVNYLLAADVSDPRILARHGVSSTTTSASAMLNLNRSFATKGVL